MGTFFISILMMCGIRCPLLMVCKCFYFTFTGKLFYELIYYHFLLLRGDAFEEELNATYIGLQKEKQLLYFPFLL